MKVRLRKCVGSRRVAVMSGEAVRPPRTGEPFIVNGPYVFENDTYRQLKTSKVTQVLGEGRFRTESGSLYQIEIIKRERN